MDYFWLAPRTFRFMRVNTSNSQERLQGTEFVVLRGDLITVLW